MNKVPNPPVNRPDLRQVERTEPDSQQGKRAGSDSDQPEPAGSGLPQAEPARPDRLHVERAAEGDRDARRELFERHRTAAYRVALRITGRNEDALDVVQDSYIKAFASLERFEGGASFKTWLLRIVTNKSLDLLRSRKVRLAVSLEGDDESGAGDFIGSTDSPPPGESMERAELKQRLEAAIDRLPPDQKAVFALYASGEMTYAQIAEAVGVPIGTVMSRIFHARRRLHEMLPDLGRDSRQSEPRP